MDRQYIDDQHIVARYLADQLPEDQREAFEAYYLEHPEMVQEIEAAARFKAGLRQLQERGDLALLLKPKPWYEQWRYIAAAAIAAVVVAATLIVRDRQPAPLLASTLSGLSANGALPLIGSSHVIVRRRGNPVDADVTLPTAGQAIELRVLPEFEASDASYRITLSVIKADDSRERIAEVGALTAADDGFVTLYANTARLEPGDYEVAITAQSSTSASPQTSRFFIRIWPATQPAA